MVSVYFMCNELISLSLSIYGKSKEDKERVKKKDLNSNHCKDAYFCSDESYSHF